MDKRKFDIVFKYFAKPIASLKETYEHSALVIDSNTRNPKVVRCFKELMDALNEQLDSYRK